jgi:hypothetical protein
LIITLDQDNSQPSVSFPSSVFPDFLPRCFYLAEHVQGHRHISNLTGREYKIEAANNDLPRS